MNLLEHYIKEVHSVDECIEEWVKEFPGIEFVDVDLTYDCHGCIEREVHCWDVNEWNEIKEQGYFMG